MVMRGKARQADKPRIPTDPCEYCGEAVGLYDWTVNGAGQLLHYPECFTDVLKGAKTPPSLRPTDGTASPTASHRT